MQRPGTRLTEKEYLAVERASEFRSEFYAGEMFAMTGASRRHNRIVTNLLVSLDNGLRDRDRNVYSSDLRVRVPATGLYTYPDVVVTCEEERFADEEFDTLLNPLLIVEVLSESTEAYDRGRKFEHYQTVGSLLFYVLVSQDRRRVEKHVRRSGNTWLYTEYYGEHATVSLEKAGCELGLEDVYAKV